MCAEAGADALVVSCDSSNTTSGISDLFCVTQAVGKQVGEDVDIGGRLPCYHPYFLPTSYNLV